MARKPVKTNEDPEQSRRFIEAAREIEADGGLNPIDAQIELDRLLSNSAKTPQKNTKDGMSS